MPNIHPVIIFRGREVHTGGERYLAEVHTYLERQSIQVIPLWLDDLPYWTRQLGLIVDCLLSNLWFFRRLRRLQHISTVVLFEDFHLHPRLWLFNLLVHLTSGRLKMVVLMQSALFYHTVLQRRWARWLDRWVAHVFLRQASLILTNSEFTRQEVLSLGIDPALVRVIYCGYDAVSAVEPEGTRAIQENNHCMRILFVGQCAQVKGIEFLLQAVSMLPDQRAVLDVVGNTASEPEYFARLLHLVEDLELQDRVTFHGHVSDKKTLAQFYQRADVFVLPSRVEGFGIVLLDAMSFGLPVVATQVGAIPELVKDGVNGLLVPPGDPAALTKAIQLLLDFPTLREQYGQAGYNYIAERCEFYSWKAVGERALQAMQPLLEMVN